MKKFMAMYMAPAATIEQMMRDMRQATPEQMKASMKEWTDWGDANKKSLVDFGAPLGKTKSVSSSGISDIKNGITGYSIVQGDSADAVAAAFKNHPHLKMNGATIELVEVMPVPGM
jgi:hypothetical protein